MALTVEENQKLLDLRRKVLENLEAGRDTRFGISPEELSQALTITRSVYARAGTQSAKTKAEKKPTKSTGKAVDLSRFGDLD